MTAKERNDFFYVCSLIEYIARETKNKRGVIVKALGKDGISNIQSDLYYQNPSYLECSYKAGYLLD